MKITHSYCVVAQSISLLEKKMKFQIGQNVNKKYLDLASCIISFEINFSTTNKTLEPIAQ